MTRSLWLVAALSGCAASPHAPSASPPAAPVPTESPASRPPAATEPAVAPAAPATPAPGSAAAPTADGTIGTAHPIVVDQLAADGSWLVICQARHDTDGDGKIQVGFGMHGDAWGDRLDPYLVFGSGPGMAIDRFVTRSADGAWFSVIRDGKLALYEARTGHAIELSGADVRDDGYPYGDARAASIADGGTRMIYFRHGGGRDHIVIRDLPSGRERVVAIEGVLWRAQVDESGRWAVLAVLPAGATWPVASTTLAPRGCRGPVMSYSTAGFQGPRPTKQWLDLERAVLVAESAVPSEASEGFEHRRGRQASSPGTQARCTRDGLCWDADAHRIALPAGEVEYAWGDHVVIRRAHKLVVFDASARTSTALHATGDIDGGSGPILTVGDGLYDIVTGARVGSSTSEAVVGHSGNRALLGHASAACTPQPGDMPYACVDGVPNLAAGGRRQVPIGPLRWVP